MSNITRDISSAIYANIVANIVGPVGGSSIPAGEAGPHTLSGSATLAAVVAHAQKDAVVLTGSGVLSYTATQAYITTEALVGSAVLATTAVQGYRIAAALAASGVMSETSTVAGLSSPWDITATQYEYKAFYPSQENAERSFYIGDSGTKLYVVGIGNDTIYQYTLESAYDISTATYASKSISTGQNTPTSVTFKPDGTEVYFHADNSNSAHHFSLSTAWDISTATPTGSYNTSTQDGSVTALSISSDGTKMYTLGNTTDEVYQYTLGTPWVVSTASYASKSFDCFSEEGSPRSMDFKPDGTEVWIVGHGGTIYQYTLETAWDASTGSYASISYVVAPVFDAGDLTCIRFRDNGESVYMGGGSKGIHQFTLGSTDTTGAYSLFGLAYASNSYAQSEEATQKAFSLSSDGTKFYSLGATNKTVYQSTLSTPWDLSSASYASKSTDISTQVTAPFGMFFKPDGSKLYVVEEDNAEILQYTLGTPWDASTISYDSKLLDTITQETVPRAVYLTTDGLKAFVCGKGADKIWSYTLSSAWDISTATVNSGEEFNVSPQGGNPAGLNFNATGTRMFWVSQINSVFQYTLHTAWNPSTATYDYEGFSTSGETTFASSLHFSPDGSNVYIGDTNAATYQYGY